MTVHFLRREWALGGLLEELLWVNEPDAYLIERNWPKWRSETVDLNEVPGNDPILLSDFVSAGDGFVSIWSPLVATGRWRGRDNYIPSVS